MYTDAPFVLFGDVHLRTIAFIIVFIIAYVFVTKKFIPEKHQIWAGYFIAFVLTTQELVNIGFRTQVFDMYLKDHLPLHLCGISVILTSAMMINRSYFLYELTYFWGMGGAIQAVLTPNVPHGFPHILNWTFFLSHGFIILGVIYATYVFNFRPTIKSIWKTFLLTNGYMLLMIPFNWIMNTNYLFICEKPAGDNLMNFMGPWPWYILSLEVVALISFWIYYSPFVISDIIRKKQT